MADSRDKKPAPQGPSGKNELESGAKVLKFSDHRPQRARIVQPALRRPEYTAPSDEDPDPGPSAA